MTDFAIRTVTSWDESFFTDFINLRSRIYEGHTDFVSESLSDLVIFFEAQAGFSKTMVWKAVLLEGNSCGARYLLSMHPHAKILNFGYFECEGFELEVHSQLMKDIKDFREKFPQIESVDGPIQGTIFNGYRFREKTDLPRFFGESLHRENYPELWAGWGFIQKENWDSFRLECDAFQNHIKALELKFGKLWQDPRIQCRSLRMRDWDQEIKNIYSITMQAYGFSNTSNEIDVVAFDGLSKKMKPIIKGYDVKILEFEGKTVGFAISYPDIQAELRRFNLRRKFLPRWLNTAVLFFQWRFFKHAYLAVYVAKSDDCPVKWAMAKISTEVLKDFGRRKYSFVMSTFNSSASGSKSTLPSTKSFYSRHILLTLPLS